MVILGKITGPHGIRGQVKVFPFTECINGLMQYPKWWLSHNKKDWQIVHPTASSIHKNGLITALDEYQDRTAAAELKGLLIAIPRDQLPELSKNGEDGYYWTDLIGSNVINMRKEPLGSVINLFNTGANDVMQVQLSNGKETLIPFLEQQVIKQVDLELRQIVVDWELDY
ncbi:ribosome maturation factor RimM [Nitrosomonas stercoris]|uniref:Ribosome maturation factor RimM n=1 Tax=Nitrosomonas stercoris TaxID=1444684 RepID=A0A4Y1YLD7_9PROT|nr:ribosome maturation factor RimM [Nitrosomonas stercoris]